METGELALIKVEDLDIYTADLIDLLDTKPDVSAHTKLLQYNIKIIARELGTKPQNLYIVCGIPIRNASASLKKCDTSLNFRTAEEGLLVSAVITAGLLRLGYKFKDIYEQHIGTRVDKQQLKAKIQAMYSHPYRENTRIKIINEASKVVKLCHNKQAGVLSFSEAYAKIRNELTMPEHVLWRGFMKVYPDKHPHSRLIIHRRFEKLNVLSGKIKRIWGVKSVEVECKCGKRFWANIDGVLNKDIRACSYTCDIEKFNHYTEQVIELTTSKRFKNLSEAIKHFGLTEERDKIRRRYRKNRRLYKHGDLIFCVGAKELNGIPPSQMRDRYHEVGLDSTYRVKVDPRVKAERAAAKEKYANSKEGKRLLLEQKATKKWNETRNPIWTPEQLKDYREYARKQGEQKRLQTIAEDPFLQGSVERIPQQECT